MCVVCPFRGGVSSCPLGAGGQALWGFRTYRNAGAGPLVVCSLLLSALTLCSRCIACEYAFICVFKAVLAGFMGFVWVCVACVLCLACAALYACGVRRFYGLLRVLPFVFFSCPLVLLSSCSPAWLPALPAFLLFVLFSCPLALSCLFLCPCGSLGFLFPLRTIRKKKGRKGFAPCVLSSCVVSVFACRSYSVALLLCFSVIIPDLQAQSIKSTQAQRISVE